jgi:hypothetical protein
MTLFSLDDIAAITELETHKDGNLCLGL